MFSPEPAPAAMTSPMKFTKYTLKTFRKPI